METLRTVVASMQAAAAKAGVQLVTGDTKVVDKGKGDGIFVNTSGIGLIERMRNAQLARLRFRLATRSSSAAILAATASRSSPYAKAWNSNRPFSATRLRSGRRSKPC